MDAPRLKTVQKIQPPYPLNEFPRTFVDAIGRDIVCLVATNSHPTLEGQEWERIFASAIEAEWKPSNVGLDDIVKGSFAWGAKTVQNPNPHRVNKIRLISGRNNPEYSFSAIADTDDGIGSQVLEIWNARVEGLRDKFKELRTVVLIKPAGLKGERLPFVIYEFETVRYPTDNYYWIRNNRNNLEGYDKRTREHKFTWQRHGSQFTVLENVSPQALKFFVKRPVSITPEKLMEFIGYDESWIEIA